MRPLKDEEKREPPSYIFKAAFENLEEQQPHIARMRTRRSSTPVFVSGVSATRNRVLQQQDGEYCCISLCVSVDIHLHKTAFQSSFFCCCFVLEGREEIMDKTIKNFREKATDSFNDRYLTNINIMYF